MEKFKKALLEGLVNKPKQWRDGQYIFNHIDSVYGVARTVQFVKGIDCFYDDSKIDAFIEAAYEVLTENNKLK